MWNRHQFHTIPRAVKVPDAGRSRSVAGGSPGRGENSKEEGRRQLDPQGKKLPCAFLRKAFTLGSTKSELRGGLADTGRTRNPAVGCGFLLK